MLTKADLGKDTDGAGGKVSRKADRNNCLTRGKNGFLRPQNELAGRNGRDISAAVHHQYLRLIEQANGKRIAGGRGVRQISRQSSLIADLRRADVRCHVGDRPISGNGRKRVGYFAHRHHCADRETVIRQADLMKLWNGSGIDQKVGREISLSLMKDIVRSSRQDSCGRCCLSERAGELCH